MKARVNLLIIISLLFFSASGEPASAASTEKEIDAANYTILGLVIGESAWLDVQSKFGFALAFGDDNDPEVQQICFISNRDETLFLLKFKHNQLIQFRLQSNKNHFYKWHFCTKSPLVSKYTATASGIKLGMSKNDIKTILGAPTEESNNRLKYTWKKAIKKTASQRIEVIDIEIDADFLGAKLVSLDLLRHTD